MIFEKIFQKIFVFKDKRLDPGDFFFRQQLKSQTVFSDFETKSAKKCATRTTGLTFVLKDDSDSDIECFGAVEEEYLISLSLRRRILFLYDKNKKYSVCY